MTQNSSYLTIPHYVFDNNMGFLYYVYVLITDKLFLNLKLFGEQKHNSRKNKGKNVAKEIK